MAKGRIETFIGFSIRAGKISLGTGAISALKGGVFLLILDGSAAKNSVRYALKFKNRFSCPLLVCDCGFEEAVNKAGCKIAAIRDRELAKAILDSEQNNYRLYTGGNVL